VRGMAVSVTPIAPGSFAAFYFKFGFELS